MIETIRLKLQNLFSRRLAFNDITINKTKLYQNMDKFVYHTALLPFSIIEKNAVYSAYTGQENINYFLSIFNEIYDRNDYTQEELNIIALFLTLKTLEKFILKPDLLQITENTVNKQSTKGDIQFFLEEIKYRYLLHLTSLNNIEDAQLIENLINELELIEDTHNDFNIYEYIPNLDVT